MFDLSRFGSVRDNSVCVCFFFLQGQKGEPGEPGPDGAPGENGIDVSKHTDVGICVCVFEKKNKTHRKRMCEKQQRKKGFVNANETVTNTASCRKHSERRNVKTAYQGKKRKEKTFQVTNVK